MLDDIIKDNEKLVYKYLHRYNGINNPDMISFAFEALYKAASTYDSSKGYAFSTYASTCIFNAIGSYLRTLKNKPIEVPYEDYMKNEVFEQPSNDVTNLMCIVANTAKDFPSSDIEIIKYWVNSRFKAKQKDIAEALKCSQAKVSNVLSKYKQKLKIRLEVKHERNSRGTTKS